MVAITENRGSRLLPTLGGLAVVAVLVYIFLPDHSPAKDTINSIASRSGVLGHAVPWTERADTAVRAMLNGSSGATAARSILAASHPTGENPHLTNYDVRQLGDHLVVQISVGWEGFITGSNYTTVVSWEFGESGHISAAVVSDNAPTPPMSQSAIDDWFRTSFYPPLHSNAGG